MAARRAATLQVKGYKEFMVACNHAEKETKRYVRATFREVGDIVRADASATTALVLRAPVSAAGYRTAVRQSGVSVYQSLKKTTGLRPWWGGIQIVRSLNPALERNQHRVEREFEEAIDEVCDHFEAR